MPVHSRSQRGEAPAAGSAEGSVSLLDAIFVFEEYQASIYLLRLNMRGECRQHGQDRCIGLVVLNQQEHSLEHSPTGAREPVVRLALRRRADLSAIEHFELTNHSGSFLRVS